MVADILISIINNKWFIGVGTFVLGAIISAIISAIITSLFSEIVKDIYSKTKYQITNSKSLFIYEWLPNVPLKNSNEVIKKIDEYPKDYAFNIETGEFDHEDGKMSLLIGFYCFKMHIAKLINTEKDKYKIYSGKYGITYSYNNISNKKDFSRYSFANSDDLIINFNEWIREIYFIKKYKKKQMLQIGLGLKGRNEIVKLDIPLVNND